MIIWENNGYFNGYINKSNKYGTIYHKNIFQKPKLKRSDFDVA